MKFSMNWVFKGITFGSLMLLLSASLPAVESQSSTPVFDELRQAFDEKKVFSAAFSHEYRDSFTGERQSTEGVIWIGKNRYKIEGDQQTVVVDGKFSTVYDGVKNRVITSDYVEEEDDFAPSRMLQGVDDSFEVNENQLADGQTQITLTSNDPFSIFLEVTIFLDSEGNPIRIEAIDQADNELITRFEAGQFVEERENMFELEIPEDAEQIDLRQGT
jgi:outer membrane lipoprotein-sorting protein